MEVNKALLLSNMLSSTESIENAEIASFNASCVSPLDITVDIDPVQEGSGDPSPDNIRPISGWNGTKVTRTGKNLFRLGVSAKTISVNGITVTPYNDVSVMVNGTNTAESIDIQLDFGKWESTPLSLKKQASNYKITYSVKIKGTISGTYDFYGGYFDKNGAAHQFGISPSTLVGTSTIPADAIRLRTWFNIPSGASASNAIIEIQAELGSTATAYEPYTAVTHEIPFSTEVYGGKLNVETGELVVDRAIRVLNGSESWAVHGTIASWFYADNILQPLPFMSPYKKDFAITNSYAQYNYDKKVTILENGKFALGSPDGNVARLVFKDTRFSTVQEWQDALAANNVQLVYQLATPVTLTLDPVEIRSLLGDNNVWTDTGNVSVRNITCNADFLELLLKTKLIGEC